MATKTKGKFRSVRKQHEDETDLETVPGPKPITNASHSAEILYNEKCKRKYFSKSKNASNPSSPSTTSDYLRINGLLSHKRNPSQSVMVRLKRLDTLRLNQRIKVKDFGFGIIQFLGCVHFAQGLFVGVELDEPNGKHDGSYHGKRYFTTKDKHGVLVKQHRVELLDINPTNDINDIINDDINFNNILNDNENMNMNDDINIINNKQQQEQEQNNDDDENMILINELNLKNKTLNNKIEEYMQIVDDLEIKISNFENENYELKEEKLHFENEMNTKIEELEEQLKQIRMQLNTKDEVLKKQISNHENTKNKYKKKIKQHEILKQKEQDTLQLIYYGNNNKDEIISQLKKKEIKYINEKNEWKKEIENVNIQCNKKINDSIYKWLFDYGNKGD